MKQETIELKPAKGFTFKPYELKDTYITFSVECRNYTDGFRISLSDLIKKIKSNECTL